MDKFNLHAGFVLAKLKSQHPNYVDLIPTKILGELGETTSKESIVYCTRTLEWLVENNFVRCAQRGYSGHPDIAETAFRQSRLTDKGLAALGVDINLRGKRERLGDALVAGAKTAGSEAGNALIAEIVGHIFTRLSMSLMGS